VDRRPASLDTHEATPAPVEGERKCAWRAAEFGLETSGGHLPMLLPSSTILTTGLRAHPSWQRLQGSRIGALSK
jgi:hypothetical protein